MKSFLVLICIVATYGGCSLSGGNGGCQPLMTDFLMYGLKIGVTNLSPPFTLIRPLNVPWKSFGQPLFVSASECSAQGLHSIDDPLSERALCPWSWKLNHDPLRIPSTLPEVACKCDTSVLWLNSQHKIMYECESVYYSIRVFRYNDDCSGYSEEFQDIPMGCVSLKQAGSSMNRGRLQSDNETQFQYREIQH